ncbi:hypothetical protein PHYBLDRAFT_63962 [Phycomyces blakesleeanus NRRL 1555(-)]|uniref:Retrotransposon gag domain-containing protein n=1 Tax=Phycomyces blakesleeanus (strain ATCC 8743b / DSM 1359 / FGSC 10004 / NBRC 33097 / NRRL 1555) TaxID=763407 RepID=A0A162PUE5_PHYB8|nr:hypothetical protein PHYBLDRAFT_63962 [Phycomyces blakesleeanus NRRL 1555(-)]OAD74086.1 hypothetical protein PHYBLDRAFT_63962 [Phycomyces blakesleeanus NRRL 1555(-)]|eukprot:XP_018292126.1 hypothetical protein PHYBLDRAFT_63962 [Phycomyces blakesleeanus NRRL 1555(-)]
MNPSAENYPAAIIPAHEEDAMSVMTEEDLIASLSDKISFASSTPGQFVAPSPLRPLHVEAVSTAHAMNDEQAAELALNKVRRVKEMIDIEIACSQYLSPSVKVVEKSSRTGGLTLNRRDLPKSFPNEEVFHSVDHFLHTFQKVIESSLQDIELVWKRFLQLCLPHSDDGWVEIDLKKCVDWNTAKICFTARHESHLVTSHLVKEVFTMVMLPSESIGDYSKKFLQAVYDAGLPKNDACVADRFLASLTRQVQTLLWLTMTRLDFNGKTKRDWTVKQLTQIGRDILDNHNCMYAEAIQLIPGANMHTERRMEAYPRKKVHSSNNKQHQISKPEHSFFCSHHSKNTTYESSKGFTLANNKAKVAAPTKRNPCRQCGENYFCGHVCKDSEPVLIVSQVPAKEKSEQVLKAIQDSVDLELEDMSFDSHNIQHLFITIYGLLKKRFGQDLLFLFVYITNRLLLQLGRNITLDAIIYFSGYYVIPFEHPLVHPWCNRPLLYSIACCGTPSWPVCLLL